MDHWNVLLTDGSTYEGDVKANELSGKGHYRLVGGRQFEGEVEEQ